MRPAIEAGLMLFVEAATLFMRPVLESSSHELVWSGSIGGCTTHEPMFRLVPGFKFHFSPGLKPFTSSGHSDEDISRKIVKLVGQLYARTRAYSLGTF
jgi:hypothetical protein